MSASHFVWTLPWDHGWSWTWFWSVTGRWYAFFSGFCGCLGMPFAAWLWLRHRNCNVKGCWRGRTHDVPGTPYRACRRHHPGVPDEHITKEHIREAYAAAQSLVEPASTTTDPK